ncbi:hypothetical protein M2459_001319 [Parabacteroides sp. PF5-5]|uniref:DUF5004 domain-containing protein n=1 Tax=unclassified Parabacteroides TaxID=2649774 RepID=UPI0024738D22|nr:MULTISPECIES: DUF5004 domain-containing protein [unclassified Parabacteroides]MDH6304584.1 hypothetical protein [Parabacteroides sp. PH5-39]MDH6315803.1 hypothetical protein [Parabacteroides sp. PF5-13]MDH6319462.1 hypothetical protein [Parabacteroides sp. PH5-13]MDH6323193.1 hypothetical protein [Parabacteroides sp. PH5-8]MDH6326995.1 hypothetical protein [Parabacteroides sp. PH5-41]
MKALRSLYAFLPFLFFVMCFAACNDTDDGSYVAPITTYEKIKGTWALKSLKQVDEIAAANSQKPSEMTLTDQFGFSSFTIALNVDGNNEPTNYSVGGNAPQLFAKEGYWELDYPFPNTDATPNNIILYSDAGKTQVTGRLAITATPGGTQTLEFKYTRKTKGVAFVSYVYQLSPAN